MARRSIQTLAFAPYDRFASITGDSLPDPPGVRTQSTRNHEAIRQWAARYRAEPATGEATASGPATVEMNDGGAGIRFNFPGSARFRPISWDEWFDNFDRHNLRFVYEEEDAQQVALRAYKLWQARGSQAGREREDWFEAEAELRRAAGGETPSAR